MNNYTYSIRQCEGFTLIGQSIRLTNQQGANLEITTQFWLSFNYNLKKGNLSQLGNWVKYAVMERRNNELFYYCAIPLRKDKPEGFSIKNIPPHHYLIVEHVGAMNKIYDTYRMIYQHILPELNIRPISDDFLHFEKYDHRFHWNKDNSIIEIWVPIH